MFFGHRHVLIFFLFHPVGVETGTIVRVPQQGNVGIGGGRAGALLVQVLVEEHPFFKRDGGDIHIEVRGTAYIQLSLVLSASLFSPGYARVRVLISVFGCLW